ncbi:MAG: hypothetical protein E6G79_00855 [Alphaproteobacteria bacterium]|nr:MAG: hypothetical protein E6G79_00855 [Alphaproteobacteria bacterium]
MDAEPVQGLSAPILQEWKEPNQRDGSEEAIQACYDLLSSGRPLLEILDAAKRLPGLKKVPQSNLGDEPADTQIREISGEARGISFQWEIAPIGNRAEAESSFVESVALVSVIGAGAPYSLVALEGQLSPDRAGIVTRGTKLSRLIGAALFWLIPAMSLSIVGTGLKSVIDADVLRMAASTTTATEAEKVAPITPTTEASRTAPQITPAEDETRLGLEQVIIGASAEPTTESKTTAQVQSRAMGRSG